MKKIKLFCNTSTLSIEKFEEKINNWINDNSTLIEIVDIKISDSATSENWSTSILIIYTSKNAD